MIQPKVGQEWDLKVPEKGTHIGRTMPAEPGETFRVEVLSVSVIDFTCTVAAPGLGWTERVSWEFLSDAGTPVKDVP